MAASKDCIKRYTTIAATLDILKRKKLPLLNPERWDDQNDRYFMELYKRKKEIGGLYALCTASCSMTYHHWRVFTNAADGACIEIKREDLEVRLKKIVKNTDFKISYDNMKYMTIKEIKKNQKNNIDSLPFIKRHGFNPESEYRIIAEVPDNQKDTYLIDFPIGLISRIYINPWLPKSIFRSIKQLINKIPGCRGLRITHSRLTDNQTWKKFGDKIVQKLN